MEVYYHLTEYERSDLRQQISKYLLLYPAPQHITIDPLETRNLTLGIVNSTSSDLELQLTFFRPLLIKMVMSIGTDGQLRIIPQSEEVTDMLRPRTLSPAPAVLVGYVDPLIPSHRDTVQRLKKFFALNPARIRLEVFVSSLRAKLLTGAGQLYEFGPENYGLSVPIAPDQIPEIFDTSKPTEVPYTESSASVSTTDASLGSVLTKITETLQKMNDSNARNPPDIPRPDIRGSQTCLHQLITNNPLPAELQGLGEYEIYGFLNYNRNYGETIEATIQRITDRYRRPTESPTDCIFRMVRNSQNFGNVAPEDDHPVPPSPVAPASGPPASGTSSGQSTTGSSTASSSATSILTTATNTSSTSTSGTNASGSGTTASSTSTTSSTSSSSASSSSTGQSSQSSTSVSAPPGSQTLSPSQNPASLASGLRVVSTADDPIMSSRLQRSPGPPATTASLQVPVSGAAAPDTPGRRPPFPGAEQLTSRHSDLNPDEDPHLDAPTGDNIIVTSPSRLNLSVAAYSLGSEQFLTLVGEMPNLEGLDENKKLQLMDSKIKKVRSNGS